MTFRYAKYRYTTRLFFWLMFLGLTVSASATTAREPGVYQERALAAPTQDFSALGLKDCQQTLSLDSEHYLAVCRLATPATTAGLRLVLVDTGRSGQSAILFQSPDFGDAYYVKLSVFSKDQRDGPDLVLAESGAEFSYGIRVYTLNHSKLHFVGDLDAVLDRDGVASSVAPALRITDTGREVAFTFTDNVMLPDRKGNYTEVAPNHLRYVLSGSKLRRLVSVQGVTRGRTAH